MAASKKKVAKKKATRKKGPDQKKTRTAAERTAALRPTKKTYKKRKKIERKDPRKYMEKICDRIQAGESLYRITQFDPDMPARSTVHLWMKNDEELRELYEFSKDVRCEKIFEEIQQISDRDNDAAGAVARDNLRCITRWRMLGVMNRAKYSEKATGKADDPIHGKADVRGQLANLSYEELEAQIAAKQKLLEN